VKAETVGSPTADAGAGKRELCNVFSAGFAFLPCPTLSWTAIWQGAASITKNIPFMQDDNYNHSFNYLCCSYFNY
jgi:hypothetical protein